MKSNYIKTECEQDLVKCETLHGEIRTYLDGLGIGSISSQTINVLLNQAFDGLTVYLIVCRGVSSNDAGCEGNNVQSYFYKCLKKKTSADQAAV